MPEETGQERTEPASPRKREDARERGEVAKSREVTVAFGLLAMGVAAYLLSTQAAEQTMELTQGMLRNLRHSPLTAVSATQLGSEVMERLLLIVAPVGLIGLAAVVIAHVGQSGLLFTWQPLAPRMDRVDPISGLKRLFGPRALFDLVKNMGKLALVGYLAWKIIAAELPGLPELASASAAELGHQMARVAFALTLRIGIALSALAAIDYAYQRWQYEQQLRMSHQEVKDELKEREGNPHIRARVRRIQRETARKRMMQAVPKADVVITNPTHVAVALRYEASRMRAPQVTAKGAGFIAQRIREIAEAHGVPIVERPPLAQALYRATEIGREVPADLYRGVAEVLAYVYRLRHWVPSPRAATARQGTGEIPAPFGPRRRV